MQIFLSLESLSVTEEASLHCWACRFSNMYYLDNISQVLYDGVYRDIKRINCDNVYEKNMYYLKHSRNLLFLFILHIKANG